MVCFFFCEEAFNIMCFSNKNFFQINTLFYILSFSYLYMTTLTLQFLVCLLSNQLDFFLFIKYNFIVVNIKMLNKRSIQLSINLSKFINARVHQYRPSHRFPQISKHLRRICLVCDGFFEFGIQIAFFNKVINILLLLLG